MFLPLQGFFMKKSLTIRLWSCESILSVRELRSSLVLQEDLFVGLCYFFIVLTVYNCCGKVRKLGSEKRVAFDNCIGLALRHQLEHILNAIKRNNKDILACLLTGFINRLNCADRHIVVLRNEAVNGIVAVGFQESFHNFLAFRGRKSPLDFLIIFMLL